MDNETQIIELLGKILANQTETNQRLENLETNAVETNQRLTQLETKVDRLEAKVDRLEANSEQVWERIKIIEQQMLAIGFELKDDVKAILAKFNVVELDAVAAKFQSIQNRNDILDLQKRLTALEDKAA